MRLTKKQLPPNTSSVQLDNKKLAFSPQLQEFRLQHQLVVVRGIGALTGPGSVLNQEPCWPSTPSTRTQIKQEADDNIIPQTLQRCWPCVSHRSHTTVAKFAQYQASSFQESLKEEQDRIASGTGRHDADTKGDEEEG